MAGVADLALGPHQPLGHRRLGHEEGAGDLGRGEAAEGAQGERDPGLEGERRVAAGEDQPQPVVGDAAVPSCRRRGRARRWTVSAVRHGRLLDLGRAAPRRAAAGRGPGSGPSVVSQAPGLRGTPSAGHRSRARAKASWAHSSARSQSPVVRMSVATTRPHSSRNARATAASTLVQLHLPDRPDLDGAVAWRAGASTPPRWPRRDPCTRRRSSRRSAPWSRRRGRRR